MSNKLFQTGKKYREGLDHPKPETEQFGQVQLSLYNEIPVTSIRSFLNGNTIIQNDREQSIAWGLSVPWKLL